MSNEGSALAHLREKANEAVINGSSWRSVCDALAKTVGGIGTVLLPFDPDECGPWLVHSESLSESFETYIKEGWYK